MKHWILSMCLMSGLAPALADPPQANPLDLGVAEVEALGTLNGQALACRDFDGSKAVKDVVIRLVPKTRRFGIVFESATNAAFLSQSQSAEQCPSETARAAHLAEVEARVREVFGSPMVPTPPAGEAKP
ncbi:MAG: hypothetical protein ACM3ST_17820 [Bdellovibrio bacteriovorus]